MSGSNRIGVSGAVATAVGLLVLAGPAATAAPVSTTAQTASDHPWVRRVLPTGSERPRLAPAPAVVDAVTAQAAQIVAGVNAERARAGKAALRVDPCLTRHGTAWSEQMASTRQLTHQSLGGMLSECQAGSVGENIGMTTLPAGTLMATWMKSGGHRRNILDARWTSIGVGVSRAADGTWYATQEFSSR